MTSNYDEVNLLRNAEIKKGERWIYSADANDPNLERLDKELGDINYITKNGGIVLLLAHQGRFGKTKTFEFVAEHLEGKVKNVVYHPFTLFRPIYQAKPGDVVVLGNARAHEGEEENDLNLARKFSKLGEKVAIGGYGKSHRKNSSNAGILQYLPGYLTQSQVDEMELLEPWMGEREDILSVAVLGGVKGEKITVGLKAFARTYDDIIPGGIVLNTGLKLKGYDIGESVISDKGETFEEQYIEAIEGSRAKIHLPNKVVIAKPIDTGYTNFMSIDLTRRNVPPGYMIASYIMPYSAIDVLKRVVADEGRLVIAGTPDLYGKGIGLATNEIIARLKRDGVRGLVLGGDSAAEIGYRGTVSGGGGAALHQMEEETTGSVEALKKNKIKFG